MTADIEAIRARITAATPEEAGLIAHVPAEDLAALCDEVEELRDAVEHQRGRRRWQAMRIFYHDENGRRLGRALVKEIRRRDQAEAELELMREELGRTRAVASDE